MENMEVAAHFSQRYGREYKRSGELGIQNTYRLGIMVNTSNSYLISVPV